MQIDPIYPGGLGMCKQAGLRLALLVLALLAGTANAQDDERTAILGVMQQAFDAVHSQNPDDWRAIQLAEGTSLFLKFGCPTDPSGLSDATPR